jgi:hypothetical protein
MSMRYSPPIRIVIGLCTALVASFPFLIIAFLLLFVVRGGYFQISPAERSQFLNTYVAGTALFSCIFSLAIYGLTAFYIADAVRNTSASEAVRTILLFAVFFLPYVGMPAYYVLYILMRQPPAWATRRTSLPSVPPSPIRAA